MQYQGGKSRIANKISEVILEIYGRKISYRKSDSEANIRDASKRERELVSLFCGTCSVEAKLGDFFDKITCNDNHEYLIAMLQGVQNGYELPDDITEEQYKYIKEHKEDDKILAGFAGFGASFGGKWWGGYGRTRMPDGTFRGHAPESKRTLLRDLAHLKNAVFTCKDYRDVEISDSAVVYADPPYAGTTQYGGIKFDTDSFWEYARGISKTNLIFISEQTAPDDFMPIWEKPIIRQLNVNHDDHFIVTEKLFIHRSYDSFIDK